MSKMQKEEKKNRAKKKTRETSSHIRALKGSCVMHFCLPLSSLFTGHLISNGDGDQDAIEGKRGRR